MDNGVFNTMMTKLGLPNISFLGDTKMALPTICLLEIWQFGSSMVMLLSLSTEECAEGIIRGG